MRSPFAAPHGTELAALTRHPIIGQLDGIVCPVPGCYTHVLNRGGRGVLSPADRL